VAEISKAIFHNDYDLRSVWVQLLFLALLQVTFLDKMLFDIYVYLTASNK